MDLPVRLAAGRCRAAAGCALDLGLPAPALEACNSPYGLKQHASPLRGRFGASAQVPSRSAMRPPVTAPPPAQARSRFPAVAMAVVVGVSVGCAHGGRPIEREIVWQSRVLVREDVLIGTGERLVIRPGTEVVFAFRDDDGDGAGDARIVIKGAVRAIGTAAAQILFAAERGGATPGWNEILIEDAAQADFVWSRFVGAQQAVHAHRTPLAIENCRFESNAIGLRFTGDPVAIRGNRFADNGTAIRYFGSSPVVAANEFEGNATAVFVREGSPRSVITGNSFYSSTDYHVKLGESQAADVEARDNWWGTDRREEIERLIFDREDVDYLGRVRYDPPAPAPRRAGGTSESCPPKTGKDDLGHGNE
jgi:hypothetical protein